MFKSTSSIFSNRINKYFSDYDCDDINVIYQRSLYAEQIPLPMNHNNNTSGVC